MELDRVPLWPPDADFVSLKRVWEYFAQYLYLPRLRDSQVFLEAVREGASSLSWQADTFAYAQAVDEDGRFRDLCAGHAETSILLSDESVLVKPEAALRQMEADAAAATEFSDHGGRMFTPPGEQPPLGGDDFGGAPGGDAAATGEPAAQPAEKLMRRFWGNVELDPNRLNKQIPDVAEHVVEHLNRLAGADVRVRLEIEADVPGGVPAKTVMDVTENARTLKFEGFGFEEE